MEEFEEFIGSVNKAIEGGFKVLSPGALKKIGSVAEDKDTKTPEISEYSEYLDKIAPNQEKLQVSETEKIIHKNDDNGLV